MRVGEPAGCLRKRARMRRKRSNDGMHAVFDSSCRCVDMLLSEEGEGRV
jgi:hypothetical protein